MSDERREAIVAALEQLPEEERRSLWLHERHGLTLHEIGQALGLDTADAERLVIAARMRVNARLREDGLREIDFLADFPASPPGPLG